MQDKVLSTVSNEVLSKTFSYNGQDMVFKDYLVGEVLPYIDLSKDTVMFKSGIEVSLKDFIEQSVFYICQNRYHGDFMEFAKDNLIGRISKQETKREAEVLNINKDDKTYVFCEELTAPKYLVVIGKDNVLLACRDGKYDIVMKEAKDKKNFLTRIKKLDFDLFMNIYNEYDVFSDYVRSFSRDKIFYNSLMVGVDNKSSFDNDFDNELAEMSKIIDLVESGNLFKDKERKEEIKIFDIKNLPLFDSDLCLKIVVRKCRAFYSEFVSDIDAAMSQNNILEKAEYVIDECLTKTINHIFYEYVSRIADAVNNNADVVINASFIGDHLEEISNNLIRGLKRLFENSSSSFDIVTSGGYINIIVDAIQNELIKYEGLVAESIEDKLVEMGIQTNNNNFIKKAS